MTPQRHSLFRRPSLEELERREVLSVTFVNSGQDFGVSRSSSVALADLNGDNTLDAFIGRYGANEVWLNDGHGRFRSTDQHLGSWDVASSAALGDVDADGDVDAFVANCQEAFYWCYHEAPNRLWLNDGSGFFHDSGQRLGDSASHAVALGDVDGDADFDAVVANGTTFGTDHHSEVWLNDGRGQYTLAQQLGPGHGVALADLDDDGDLDTFLVNADITDFGPFPSVKWTPNTIWLNDGRGHFRDSGQRLGRSMSLDIAVADFDGDYDLDAFVANAASDPDRVWINDGSGVFSDSGQSLGESYSDAVAMGDVDLDGDWDAVVLSISAEDDRVWLNDGHGVFHESAQGLGSRTRRVVMVDLVLGDLDKDRDLDVFITGDSFIERAGVEVFFNQSSVSPFVPGDANRDGKFDQQDVVQVLQSGTYLTGQPAGWAEGDWNGDSVFDQLDIVAALSTGAYVSGTRAALAGVGWLGDDQTSIVSDCDAGGIALDAPAPWGLTSDGVFDRLNIVAALQTRNYVSVLVCPLCGLFVDSSVSSGHGDRS